MLGKGTQSAYGVYKKCQKASIEERETTNHSQIQQHLKDLEK